MKLEGGAKTHTHLCCILRQQACMNQYVPGWISELLRTSGSGLPLCYPLVNGKVSNDSMVCSPFHHCMLACRTYNLSL